MERTITYNFFIDLESIQHKLSFDYSFSLYVSRPVFPILMVHTSLRTNLYKMFIFERSVICSYFKELCSHIDKNSGEKV